MGLFDERPLFELTHPALPGERLVACRNPALATSRAHTRDAVLEAAAAELAKVEAMVGRGLTRQRVTYLLHQAAQRARETCPSLAEKRVAPHVVRHNTEPSITVS